MKGLFLKELYTLNVYKKNLFLLLVVIIGLSIFLPLGASYAPAMMMMYLIIIGMNLYTLDETAKWDRFALSMPVTRLQIVATRYLFLLGMVLGMYVLSFALNAVLSFVRPQSGWFMETLVTNGSMGLVFLLITALSAPLCYRFGAEKSRLALTLIFMVPYVAVIWALPVIVPFLAALSPAALTLLVVGAIVLTLAFYLASCFFSTRIYAKKEF